MSRIHSTASKGRLAPLARGLAAVGATCLGVGLLAGCSSEEAVADDPLTIIVSTEHNVMMLGPESADFLDNWSDCSPDLDVEVTAGDKVAEALAAGQADIGITSPNSMISAINEGLEAKITGASAAVWAQYPVVSPDTDADSFDDLKGATFGVTKLGSAGHYALTASARSQGWVEGEDYTVQPLGSFTSLQAALKSGTIDAMLWSGTGAFTMEENGDATVLGIVKDIVGPNAMTVYGASESALKERPELIKAAHECMYESIKTLQQDPEKAKELFASWDLDDAVAQREVEEEIPIISTDGALEDDVIEGMLDATQSTVPDTESLTVDDVKGMILPWTEIE